MPWQKKASAPSYANAGDAFATLITGDASWGWLIDWIPLMGNEQVDVAALCSQGPATVDPLTASDFALGARNPLARIANTVVLVAKLRAAAYDRIFGAYCENVSDNPTGWTPDACYSGSWDGHTGPNGPIDVPYWTPIPDGATRVRLHATALSGLDATHTYGAMMGVPNGAWSNIHVYSANNDTALYDVALSAGATHYAGEATGGGVAITMCYSFNVNAGTPYTPTPQPPPPGVVAPTKRTYSTIPDLGAELDRQELKLDYLSDQIKFLAAQASVGGTVSDPAPIDATNGATIDVAAAVGAVVTLSNVPAGLSEAFGDPPRLYARARLEMGTDTAWYPPIEVAHSPLVIQPLPLQCTRLRVRVVPPATASVTRLFPPK